MSDDDSIDDSIIGERLMKLRTRSLVRTWIIRRFETLRSIDERTMTREITFEIDLSKFSWDQLPMLDGSTVILPLHRLTRSVNSVVQVHHDVHGELSRPAKQTERRLVAGGLIKHWSDKSPSIEKSALESILECISLPRKPIPMILQRTGLFLDAGRAKILETVKEAASLSESDAKEFRNDLWRWQNDYLLLVQIPLNYFDEKRILIRLTYHQSTGDGKISSLSHATFKIFKKIFASTVSMSFQMQLGGIGDSASSHVVIEAPVGFRVVDPAIIVDYCFPGRSDTLTAWYRSPVEHASGAHIYVDTEGRDVESANLAASFYSYKSGLLFESVIAAWILAVILGVFYHRLAEQHFHAVRVGFNQTMAASLILLVPAAVVTLLTQRDAHRLASKCFLLTRVLLGLTAVSTLVAAMSLALPTSALHERYLWSTCLLVSFCVALRLSSGVVLHWWRTSSLRLWILTPGWTLSDLVMARQLDDADAMVGTSRSESYENG